LEELLPRQVLALLGDPGEARVFDLELVLDAALAAKLQLHLAARKLRMAVAERRQPEGVVVLRVLIVADADERHLHEFDDCG
jgi:hypothetical protein